MVFVTVEKKSCFHLLDMWQHNVDSLFSFFKAENCQEYSCGEAYSTVIFTK